MADINKTAHNPLASVESMYSKGVASYRNLLLRASGQEEREVQAPAQEGRSVTEGVLADMERRRKMALEEYESTLENVATGPLDYSQYYPNSNQPLSVGTFQGSTFSAPILAPTLLNPMARRDAMEKAKYDQQTAAMKTALDAEASFELSPLSNAFCEDDVNDKYYSELNSLITDFQELYGNDWQGEIMRSERFKRLQNNYNSLVNGLNQASALFSDMLSKEASGEIVISPETKKLMQEFQSGSTNNIPITDMDSVSSLVNSVQAESALQNILTTGGYKDMMKASVSTAIDKIEDKSSYEMWQTTIEQTIDEAADAVAEELSTTIYAGSKVYTKEYIAKYIKSTSGRSITKEMNQYWTSQRSSGGTGTVNPQQNSQVLWQMARQTRQTGDATGLVGAQALPGRTVVDYFNTGTGQYASDAAFFDAIENTYGIPRGQIINGNIMNKDGDYLILQLIGADGRRSYVAWDKSADDFESKFVNAMDASMNAGNRQGADLYSPLNGGAGAGNAGTGTGAAAAGGSSR